MRVSLLVLFASLCQGIYVLVNPSQEKCFKEEVPAKQYILAKYKQFNNPGVPCMVVFKDKRGYAVSSQEAKTVNNEQFQAAYLTPVAGDVSVCIKCMGSKWSDGAPIKWEIRIDVGGEYLADQDAANKDDVDSVASSLIGALNRALGLTAEHVRIRISEQQYSDAHIDSNSKVLWMNVFAIAAVIVCAIAQAMTLRNFFKAEKLV